MDKQQQDNYQKRVDQQHDDFRLTFSTEAGQRVLKALKEEYYDCDIGPDSTMFAIGQRDVIHDILLRLEEI